MKYKNVVVKPIDNGSTELIMLKNQKHRGTANTEFVLQSFYVNSVPLCFLYRNEGLVLKDSR